MQDNSSRASFLILTQSHEVSGGALLCQMSLEHPEDLGLAAQVLGLKWEVKALL